MILEPPASVQKLQTALQVKAKGALDRFHLLYDKVYRKDALAYAYQRCKANNGAPGIDGQDFADVEAYGEERWLDELADALRGKTYRPDAVRPVWIPKANGPLGIHRLADRVAMTAATVVLEAIFILLRHKTRRIAAQPTNDTTSNVNIYRLCPRHFWEKFPAVVETFRASGIPNW